MSANVLFPNLLAELARQGKTRADLGIALGLSPSSISDRLSGSVEFDLSEIKATCKFLGKSFDDLF